MSKFKELCGAYSGARKHYAEYRTCCGDFGNSLIKGMIEYFECPREHINFFPLAGDVDPKKKYSLVSAMLLDDDTYWHFGLGLTLCPAESESPDETVVLPFAMKKGHDLFIVRIGTLQEFQIHENNQDEYQSFYNFVFQRIKEDYEKGLQRFLDKEVNSRKIGFQS